MSNILKYTPLLKRSLLCVLSLCFLFGVLYSPPRAKAYFFLTEGMNALNSMFIASDFAVTNSDSVNLVVNRLWNTLSDAAKKEFAKAEASVAEKTPRFYVTARLQFYFLRALANSYSEIKYHIHHPLVSTEADLTNDILIEEDTKLALPQAETYKEVAELRKEDVVWEELQYTNKTLESLQDSFDGLKQKFDAYYDEFLGFRKGVGNLLNAINSNTYTELRNIHLLINNNVLGWLDTINKNLHDDFYALNTTFTSKFNGLVNKLDTVQREIVAPLDTLNQRLVTVFPALQTSAEELTEIFNTVYHDQLVVEKPQLEVFVGQQQFLVSDYASMGNAFSAKMGWVTQIFDFLEELRSRLNSGTPPKVAIDLSAAEGSFNYGGEIYIMDMSWYSRYKPSVDTILSGIMWLCFGWALYKRIPDILSGVGMTVENATQPQGHVWSERAERSASLQYYSDRRQDYYNRRGR